VSEWLRDSSAMRRPEWDLAHLRTGAAVTALLAVAGVPATWLWRDGRAALWVLAGLTLVAVFFSTGAWLVAKAGAVDDQLTLPAALASYVVKVVLLGIVLVTLRDRTWVDGPALAWSVVVGLVAWVGAHVWRVLTTPTYYVDPDYVEPP
jgi:ATP synthase protein I